MPEPAALPLAQRRRPGLRDPHDPDLLRVKAVRKVFEAYAA
jgi:hypothetical protein